MNEGAATNVSPDASAVILLVEDEILIRLDLAEELRAAGMTVIEASNADEARAVLASIDRVSLVITDVRMPGRDDGLKLARWLRQEMSDIRIVLMSAHLPASQLGSLADLAVEKPFHMARFIEQVRQLLTAPSR